jgi:hypothetical protein
MAFVNRKYCCCDSFEACNHGQMGLAQWVMGVATALQNFYFYFFDKNNFLKKIKKLIIGYVAQFIGDDVAFH